MDEFDMLEDIETGYEVITGAPARRRVVRRVPARQRYQGATNIGNRSPLSLPQGSQPDVFASAVPGIPTPGKRVRQLGLSPVTFTSTSGTLLTMSTVCQKPFAPRRLFIDFARVGATATGALSLQSAKIGSDEQLISGGVPVTMFAGNVQDIDLQWDESAAGLTIALQILVSAAPGAGDSITVVGALHGVTFGQ